MHACVAVACITLAWWYILDPPEGIYYEKHVLNLLRTFHGGRVSAHLTPHSMAMICWHKMLKGHVMMELQPCPWRLRKDIRRWEVGIGWDGISVMVLNVFSCHPRGNDRIWRACFSNGLKPPTRNWKALIFFGFAPIFLKKSHMFCPWKKENYGYVRFQEAFEWCVFNLTRVSKFIIS